MPPKLAVILTRNSRKVVVVLTYVFLEWALILLLLSNSIFSYIITKFANYFSLKKPCILCSRVDHLLEPAKTRDSYKALVCEIHATEISKLGYCSNHQRFAESQQMCQECFSTTPKNVLFCQSLRCSCCDKIHSHSTTFRQKVVIREIVEEGLEYSISAQEDSNADDHAAVGKQMINSKTEDRTLSIEESDHFLDEMRDGDHDIFFRLKQLKSNLEAEQKSRNELYAELEAERNAAAIAANQTMAMITRLQEEKAAMQMEALQYQRVMEEQAQYDQEALNLLNELMAKREREKEELEKELDGYREKVSDYESKEKTMMLIQKCSGDFSSSYSIDNDSDVLSIDLNRQYNKVEDSNDNKDTSLMECSKQWGAIEDSLEELEEERMSIIKQLKELEEKLHKGAKQDIELLQDEKDIEQNASEDQHKNELNTNAELCSQEVNLVSCFSAGENHPKTMASVARRLLDLVESDDSTDIEDMALTNEVGFDRETESNRRAMEKEMNHVYGRLQALEADTEFLRHCIASVNKGSEGLILLQEILQHLRELRDAEICL